MISRQEAESVDLNLVDQVIERIPDWTWSVVKDAIIANIVDNMPGEILEKLTGKYDDFNRAEEILMDYYHLPERKDELIIDGFKIFGTENTLYLLDSLQLDKLQDSKSNNEVS